VLPKKNIYFPSPLFGFFYFFVLFNFLNSLKKNKRMLHYKQGTSVTSILFPSARNTLMLRARRHVQEKDTQGKNPPWVKVSSRRGKVLQGLHIRHA
jgi:hypothetical protein